MSVSRNDILDKLRSIPAGDGGDIVSSDLVRALEINDDSVRFVIEAADADAARALEPARAAAEAAVAAMDGVARVTVVLTAPAAKPAAPPNLKIGRHATPEPMDPSKAGQIDRILAIGSGKGGVGKSTVSSNLAVALAKEGRKVGLLDADVYGPSQPRMMGVNKRPASPDGKTIIPLQSHGVTLMSIGFMLAED